MTGIPEETIHAAGMSLRVYRFAVLVAGSGAAGFNAADTLADQGLGDIALITEAVKGGTSRNTGSDKQTYYKLSLAGPAKDSVRDLAESLFSGGAVDGDIALAEAAASVPCFMKLVRLGLPFPKNPYGEYVGYKTDHDPARRATSVGPYTSRFMTEALEKEARAKGVPVFDRMQIVKLLVREGKAAGILCLDLDAQEDPRRRFVVFQSPRIVWATGGPAGIYESAVYPPSQQGAAGAALEAGALGRNLTEWQYGLASVKPRWNVSGTYMQALPRFISTGEKGEDEREFLADYFSGPGDLLSRVFLKGYQWPFDVRKLEGSSLIDILVWLEKSRGRRVFLDFRSNPLGGGDLDFSLLSPEARDYLAAAGACFGTPADRLLKMNKPAYDFFLERGTDLRREALEIALSAQHNNGGLSVDHWWRSNIEGLFPVGEAAATHGVYRPGGSALNAGQAGSFRAASFIAQEIKGGGLPPASPSAVSDWPRQRPCPATPPPEIAREACGSKMRHGVAPRLPQSAHPVDEGSFLEGEIAPLAALAEAALGKGRDTVSALIAAARRRMTRAGGAFRNAAAIAEAREETGALLKGLEKEAGLSSPKDLSLLFRLRDILITQFCYLSAMEDYIARGGKSRGSALYHHREGTKPLESLPEEFRSSPDKGALSGKVQELRYENGVCQISWREVRPIPPEDGSFEAVWSAYREGGEYR